MNKKLPLLLIIAVSLMGCKARLDFNDTTLIDTISPAEKNRFDIESYEETAEYTASIDGTWVMVINDFEQEFTAVDELNNTNINAFNGKYRSVCRIEESVSSSYFSNCFPLHPEFILAGNTLTSTSGEVVINVISNTRMNGVINAVTVSDDHNEETTIEQGFSFSMVKIDDVNTVIGSQTVTHNGVTTTSESTGFVEAILEHTYTYNDEESVFDFQHVLVATDINEHLVSINIRSDQNDASASYDTVMLEGYGASDITINNNSVTAVSFSVEANDPVHGEFSASADVNF